MVTVVLVILILINIGLTYYLYWELKETEIDLLKSNIEIISIIEKDSLNIEKKIKEIPKEITVKNYLKIP